METFAQDLRFAFRQIRRSPGFAIIAILSIGLGIGATTSVFSVIYGVLLNPYPYKDADRMMHVELTSKQYGGSTLLFVNRQEYQDLLAAKSIEDSFTAGEESRTLTGGDMPATAHVTLNSPNIFTFMGMPALIGRTFTTADAPGTDAPQIAVLSYLFWQRQFGGRKDIVGKTVQLNHQPYTVIGVAPPRFTWNDADIYLPVPQKSDPRDHRMAFSRLRPGVTYAAAQAELSVLVSRWEQQDKAYPKDCKIEIVSLNHEVLGKFEGTLVLLFGSVLLLLLVGCGNVSIMLLARGNARQHELAVRSSVGASRGRIVRQLLTESVLLALAGGAMGVGLAFGGVSLITHYLPAFSFPHEASIAVSFPVLGVTALIAVLTGIVFGLSPALQLSRPEISQLVMQAGSARQAGSTRGRRTHNVLIAGQVALTLLLLVGAGAAMQQFMKLYRTPLGYEPEHVLGLHLAMPQGSYPTWDKRLQALEQLRQAVATTPGVTSASVSTTWIPPFSGFETMFDIEGRPTQQEQRATLTLVSPQILNTLQIPLLRGRMFDDAEHMRAAHLALVNQAMVNLYFAGQDPIGQHVRSPMLKVEQPGLLLSDDPDGWLEIIGVVADARNRGIAHPPGPAIYLPASFVLLPDVQIFARTVGDPEAAEAAIRRQVLNVSQDIVVSDEHPLTWWLWTEAWGRERFVAALFAAFAGLALALAATGLYGVVSYAVSQRTREFGVRMAVGAQRSEIVKLVLRSAAVTVGAGAAIGLVLSLALNRLLSSWAGGSSRSPIVLLSVSCLLLLVAGIACLVPASRAASIDPSRALRAE